MTNIKIISETPVTMVELKEEIDKIRKRDEELNFRANKTEEYLNMFAGIKPEKVKELKEKIEKLNVPLLKEEYIVKIIDLLPLTMEEVKVILQGYPITINNENAKKIADIVKAYIPKNKENKTKNT